MGLKSNLAYGYALTLANYLFPLIVFPYVTRTLGAENFGICNWATGIIDYYMMFSMMGISTIGVREIAASRNNKMELSRTFSALVYLNLITTIIAIIALVVTVYTYAPFYQYRKLFFIGICKLATNTFLIEWFFKGIEDFKYITQRTVAVRMLYILSVFVFVRDAQDYVIYFALTIGMTVVNAIINTAVSVKYVSYVKSKIPRALVRSFFIIGAYSLLNSAYATFNVIYLGIVHSKTQVGYYTTATKIFTIILMLYGTWTTVILPRISALLAEKNFVQIRHLIGVSINLVYSLIIPVMIIGFSLSDVIIMLVGGSQFIPAGDILKVAFLILPVIGLEQIFVIQIMMPFKADKYILINSVISATVGIVLGYFLIRRYAAMGSVVTWAIIELCVFAASYMFVWKLLKVSILTNVFFKVTGSSLVYLLICWITTVLFPIPFIRTVVIVVLSFIWFYCSNKYFIKEEAIMSVIAKIEHKFRRLGK